MDRKIVDVYNAELKQKGRALRSALPYMKGWEEAGADSAETTSGDAPQDSGAEVAEVPDDPADPSAKARRWASTKEN